MEQVMKNPKDKWILWCFIAFFGVIALLDGVFVYIAVSTQTGVVIEQPYEKGLAFNKTLEKAKAQPVLAQKISYVDGVLRWELPMTNAVVKASFFRPVQDGYDFDITLNHVGNGVYQAEPVIPLPGRWTAKLSATWDNKQFQITHDFIAP